MIMELYVACDIYRCYPGIPYSRESCRTQADLYVSHYQNDSDRGTKQAYCIDERTGEMYKGKKIEGVPR